MHRVKATSPVRQSIAYCELLYSPSLPQEDLPAVTHSTQAAMLLSIVRHSAKHFALYVWMLVCKHAWECVWSRSAIQVLGVHT